MPYDFDGDGRADMAYISNNNSWYKAGASTPFYVPPAAGAPSTAVSGDYDGDGRWEAAIVRDDGTWITNGTRGTFTFARPPAGSSASPGSGSTARPLIIPVPADYDGDGRTDAAWYREGDATWWIQGKASPVTFGTAFHGGSIPDYDIPVPDDYDGDGRADIATYSPHDGTFKIVGAASPIAVSPPAGFPGAVHDATGRAYPGAFHQSGTNPGEPFDSTKFNSYLVPGMPTIQLGPADVAVPANYDGAPGDERATFTLNGPPYGWRVEGSSTLTTSVSYTPVSLPAAVLFSVLRLTFAAKCLYYYNGGC